MNPWRRKVDLCWNYCIKVYKTSKVKSLFIKFFSKQLAGCLNRNSVKFIGDQPYYIPTSLAGFFLRSAGLWVVCGCGVPFLAFNVWTCNNKNIFTSVTSKNFQYEAHYRMYSVHLYIGWIPYCIFNFLTQCDFAVGVNLKHLLLRASLY